MILEKIKQWFLHRIERLRKDWEAFIDDLVKDPES